MTAILNDSQVFLLQTLRTFNAANGPMPRSRLDETSKGSATPSNLGPANLQTLKDGNGKYAGSLFGLGFVQPCGSEESDNTRETSWKITDKGLKAVETYRARKRGANVKVPSAKLDKEVKKLRNTRTYGLELFTTDDLKELRTALGDDYANVTLEDLRQQITNRRKQGAFADPKAKIAAAVKKAILDFGPEGRIASLLTAKQVTEMQALLV